MTMMDDDVHACRYDDDDNDDDDIFSCTCNHVSNILCSYPVGPLISGPQQTVSQSESDRADPAVSSVFCLFGWFAADAVAISIVVAIKKFLQDRRCSRYCCFFLFDCIIVLKVHSLGLNFPPTMLAVPIRAPNLVSVSNPSRIRKLCEVGDEWG